MGDRAVGRRGMRRGGGVSGRAAGMRRARRWSAYTPSAAALRRDGIVKCLDLGVEQLEGPLPINPGLAVGSTMAHRHRLKNIRAIGPTGFLILWRLDAALAHRRPAEASRGEIGEL